MEEKYKTKITLELHGEKFTVETNHWDYNADELLDMFKRLMVCATYPPSILSDEEGSWEWHENRDTIE